MKKNEKSLLFVLMILFLCTPLSAEIFSGNISIGGAAKYISRGEIISDLFSIQPGVDLNLYDFNLNLFSSYSLEEKEFSEIDATLTYTKGLGFVPLNLILGIMYYDFPGTVTDAWNGVTGLSADIFLSPALIVYYGFRAGDGMYSEFNMTLPFTLGIDFELLGSVGYNSEWGYSPSLTVAGLNFSAAIPVGPFEITPGVFGQLSLNEQYRDAGFASISISYNF